MKRCAGCVERGQKIDRVRKRAVKKVKEAVEPVVKKLKGRGIV